MRACALVLLLALAACIPVDAGQPEPVPTDAAAPAPAEPSGIPLETAPSSITPFPEATASTLIPTPIPATPTLDPLRQHPLFPFTIPGLRERVFPGGQLSIRAVLDQSDAFTRYSIAYPSDGLTITGIMHMPTADPPFPVVILLHGYIDRDRYFSGADTWQAAEFFARQGYLALAPDLRSWGGSDTALSVFHMGLVIDALNLVSAAATIPEADPERVVIWGHSMGGGIATKMLVIDERIRAAVLYAPNSADDADLIARWGAGCQEGQSQDAGDMCNPAEILPAGISPALVQAYVEAARDQAFLQQVAPLYHLERVAAPIQIHIGTADGQFLSETPVAWSLNLFEALEAAGREAELYIYEDQGHAFTGESWVQLLARALSFYEIHLGRGP